MTGSQVDLLVNGLPTVMAGRIVSLDGQRLVARVAGAGRTLDVHANLSIDQGTGSVTGTLSATSPTGG